MNKFTERQRNGFYQFVIAKTKPKKFCCGFGDMQVA
jgi:hypothetical protein